MFVSHGAVSSVMSSVEECFSHSSSYKAPLFRGLEEEEDGGMGGLMFLSEEAAPQTDSSVFVAFRRKTRI